MPEDVKSYSLRLRDAERLRRTILSALAYWYQHNPGGLVETHLQQMRTRLHQQHERLFRIEQERSWFERVQEDNLGISVLDSEVMEAWRNERLA